LLLIMLFARPRARRLAVADYLLLGLAVGLGFQAVEDAMRRLALTVHPQGLLGLLSSLLGGNPDDPASGYPQYGLGLLPGWSDNHGRAFFGGHHRRRCWSSPTPTPARCASRSPARAPGGCCG
jgi:hypothetical protein